MLSNVLLLLFPLLRLVVAQQYQGSVVSAFLPTISGAEVCFFQIPDPTGQGADLSLINYYSLASDGGRIDEAKIQRAIIVVHGLLRDPWAYQQDVSDRTPFLPPS